MAATPPLRDGVLKADRLFVLLGEGDAKDTEALRASVVDDEGDAVRDCNALPPCDAESDAPAERACDTVGNPALVDTPGVPDAENEAAGDEDTG